ncbi:hypothetical protein D9M71_253600 [compost metagenome]
MDQVGDGADLDAVLLGEGFQLRPARHAAVVVHHLDDHRGRGETGQARQVAAGFGMAGAGQHAAFAGAQGEDVAGLRQVVGLGVGSHGGEHRMAAVGGGDAGGHSAGGLDGDGEGGGEDAAVGRHHLLQAEALAVLVGQGQADQAARLAGHEVDRRRRAFFRGQQQVALVLAVLVVHQQDHLALAIVFDDFFDAIERHGRCPGWIKEGLFGIP